MTITKKQLNAVCDDFLQFMGGDGCPTLVNEVEHYRHYKRDDIDGIEEQPPFEIKDYFSYQGDQVKQFVNEAIEDCAIVVEEGWSDKKYAKKIAKAIRELKDTIR